MTKAEAIQRLKEDFILFLNMGDPLNWSDNQFKHLSEELANASGIQISITTLKRLFGKIKFKTDYKPHDATLNAMALMLGKKTFYYYRKSLNEQETIKEHIEEKKSKHTLKYILIGAGATSLVFTLFFVIYIFNNEKKATKEISTAIEPEFIVEPRSSDADSCYVRVYFDIPDKIFKQRGSMVMLDKKIESIQSNRENRRLLVKGKGAHTFRLIVNGKLLQSRVFK